MLVDSNPKEIITLKLRDTYNLSLPAFFNVGCCCLCCPRDWLAPLLLPPMPDQNFLHLLWTSYKFPTCHSGCHSTSSSKGSRLPLAPTSLLSARLFFPLASKRHHHVDGHKDFWVARPKQLSLTQHPFTTQTTAIQRKPHWQVPASPSAPLEWVASSSSTHWANWELILRVCLPLIPHADYFMGPPELAIPAPAYNSDWCQDVPPSPFSSIRFSHPLSQNTCLPHPTKSHPLSARHSHLPNSASDSTPHEPLLKHKVLPGHDECSRIRGDSWTTLHAPNATELYTFQWWTLWSVHLTSKWLQM